MAFAPFYKATGSFREYIFFKFTMVEGEVLINMVLQLIIIDEGNAFKF